MRAHPNCESFLQGPLPSPQDGIRLKYPSLLQVAQAVIEENRAMVRKACTGCGCDQWPCPDCMQQAVGPGRSNIPSSRRIHGSTAWTRRCVLLHGSRLRSVIGLLRICLDGVHHGRNWKGCALDRYVGRLRPRRGFCRALCGLEPSTPPYPRSRGNGSQPVATVLADFQRSRPLRFATGCRWLRPLGSINAPFCDAVPLTRRAIRLR